MTIQMNFVGVIVGGCYLWVKDKKKGNAEMKKTKNST